MPINPFPRVQGLDLPTALPSAAAAPPGTFANLGSIGDAIGEYRDRQAMTEIARGAIDPKTGSLDMSKLATAIALSGRDPARMLALMQTERGQTRAEAAQKALEAYHSATVSETARANAAAERQRQQQLDQPSQTVVPPSLLSPGGAYTVPRDVTQPPTFRQFPPSVPPPPPPPVVAPQSALPGGGPNLAAADPENAPPYRVAGPPMPPPAQAAPVVAPPVVDAPATGPTGKKPSVYNEGYLQTLPPNGQVIVKGVANYEIDPGQFQGKERDDIITAAKIYRPDYNTSEYQKRGTPPSGEVAGRTGLSKSFLDIYPDIKKRIEADELNTVGGRAAAHFGQGYPGELVNAVKEGAESLLRGLTGAGMNKDEASDYAKRYGLNWYDTKETQRLKIRGLDRALRYVTTEVGKGRGGEDLIKDYKSQFGAPLDQQQERAAVKKVTNDAEATKAIQDANEALSDKRVNASNRAAVLKDIHQRLREKNVPPALWPR